MTTITTANNAFLTFRLAQQEYALPIDDVVEVAVMVEITRLAGAPPVMLGVVNRHGTPVPLLDLRLILEQPAAAINISTLFIVAQHQGKWVGLVVDEVLQVEYAAPSAMGNTRYIERIISQDRRLIQVISLEAVLTAHLPDGV
jgi:purine-binding chemotaxis protein CheW